MATSRSRRVSRAFHTSPMPPAPRAERISYGPTRVPDARTIEVVRIIDGEPRYDDGLLEGFSMILPTGARDLVRIVLGVLLILLLISSSLSILSPFLPALIWATMIVVATWPLLRQLQRALGGRRSLAAAAMTALLFVIVIAPLAVAISVVVQQA